ncbi:putative high-affinity glucose transporter of the major facilitator superfamily [Meredithblackwellia eburnea MCA 4105]
MPSAIARDSDSKPDSFTQNSRVYVLALIAYCGIFLFGYDTGVAGGVVGLKSFTDSFGYTKKSALEIANIKSWIVSILMLGAFAGSVGAAPLCQWLGRKKSLLIAVTVFIIGSAIQTAATHSVGQMYAGRFIGGLGVGSMSIAEVSPKEARGRITGLFQILVAIGVAISYWITYGFQEHFAGTTIQWRFPIGFQLIPAVVMFGLLFFIRESPRWLVYNNEPEKALVNLAWVRKRSINDPKIQEEIAEIQAAIQEERDATTGASIKEAWAPGNRKRFFIAFFMFFFQQWSGQNSISYYSPLIFQSIGINGTSTGLLASGIYGLVKIVATSIFIFFGIERIGRSKALGFGGAFMSMFLWIIGAIYYTHIPNVKATSPSSSSIAMAAMIYCFVIPYCFSWGPTCWVYCSEIFPMRLRPYGMGVASSTQWIFNFCITKITPTLVIKLPNGRLFFLFAAMNVVSSAFGFWLPETAGVSIEEMDVLFGAVTREERDKYLQEQLEKRQAEMMSIDTEKAHESRH